MDNFLRTGADPQSAQGAEAQGSPVSEASCSTEGSDAPKVDGAMIQSSPAQAPPGEPAVVARVLDEPMADHLTDRQVAFLRALASGKKILFAAAAAGVSRSTVYRWQSDSHFVAALNAWRQHSEELTRNRLLVLAEKAVDALDGALAGGDRGAALSVLKAMGMLAPVRRGLTDAHAIDRDKDMKARRRQLKQDRRLFDLNRQEMVMDNDAKTWKLELPRPEKP